MPPPTPDRAPTVLILGGLQTLARPLALYLSRTSSPGSAARAAFIRIVDRFSVSPPSTYLDQPFARLLADGAERVEAEGATNGDGEKDPDADAGAKAEPDVTAVAGPAVPIEYKQANLSLVARHQDIYTPPSNWNGEPRDWATRGFEVVYDLTGEMGFDRPELVSVQVRCLAARARMKGAAACSVVTDVPHARPSYIRARAHAYRCRYKTRTPSPSRSPIPPCPYRKSVAPRHTSASRTRSTR